MQTPDETAPPSGASFRLSGALRFEWIRSRRATRIARLALDKLPVTPLGALVAGGATLAVLYYGRKRQDLVLYVAGLGIAGLLVLSLLAVILATLALFAASRRAARRPAGEVTRLEAGAPATTGFSLPALGLLPLVALRWEWIEPERVEVRTRLARGRLVEEVTPRERGEHRRAVRRVIVEDAFGLARLAFRLAEETPLLVLPARGRPFAAPLLETLAGGDNFSHPAGPPDGDLVEMRRYVAGDPMKRVLWKTYARTRTLMVRTPERAIAPTRRTLAYLVAGAGDEPPAGVARMALETQALGPDWRFGADGSSTLARTVEDALPLVVRSRAARDRQGEGLHAFLSEAADLGESRCILFVPAHPGAWLAPVEHEVRRRAGRVEVIVATDGIRQTDGAGRWRRLLYREAPAGRAEETARQRDVEAVTERLARAGATVRVVDRLTGRLTGRVTGRLAGRRTGPASRGPAGRSPEHPVPGRVA